MDILKELFGTSDELQISKSLFGGDGGAGSEELVLDNPPVSPSRDYLSSRPLPLLPVEPRPQIAATSLLIRSQSLDDLHAPSNDVDNLFRPDVLRAQSVFPQLSETGTSNHVNLHNVPHEMPMYLLEEDEGNDEEIMRLLETTTDSTPNRSGTSSGTGGTPNGTATPPNRICCSNITIERVAMEIVAMETDESPGDEDGVVVETEEAGSMDIGPVLKDENMGPFVGMSVEVTELDEPSAVAVHESTSEMTSSHLSPSSPSPPPLPSPPPVSLSAPSPKTVVSLETQTSSKTISSSSQSPSPTSSTSSPSPKTVNTQPSSITASKTSPLTRAPALSLAPSPSLNASGPPVTQKSSLTPAHDVKATTSHQTQQLTLISPPSPPSPPSLRTLASFQSQPSTVTLSPSPLPATAPLLSPLLSTKIPIPSSTSPPSSSNSANVTSPRGVSTASRTHEVAEETSAVTTATTDITTETSVIAVAKTTPTFVASLSTAHLPTIAPAGNQPSSSSTALSSPPALTDGRSSAAIRPSSLFPSRHTIPVSMTTRPTQLSFHSNQTRGQSLSPPQSIVRSKPPLPLSLPLSPPLLSLPPPSIPLQQATPTTTPPPTSMQQSIDQLRLQVRLQSQKLEQALKSFLPQPKHKPYPPTVSLPVASLVVMATSSLPPPTTTTSISYPSLRNAGFMGNSRVDEVKDASSLETTNKERGNSDLTLVSTSSIAVQASSTERSTNLPVSMATKQTTPPQAPEQQIPVNSEGSTIGSHDDMICESNADDVISNEQVGVAVSSTVSTSLETASVSNNTIVDGESPGTSGHRNNVTSTVVGRQNVSVAVQTKTMATSQNMETVTTTIHSIPSSPKLLSPLAPFCSTFSVCVPDMNWRVQPFGSVLGMKALPITILPPSSSSSSLSNNTGVRESETSSVASSGGAVSADTTEPQTQRAKRRRNGGGWPKGKRRKIVENNTPKPPSTAYSLYLSEQRQKGKFDSMSMSQLSKTIGKMWGQLPPQAKQEYQERAVKDRERYLNDLKTHLTQKQKENSSCNLESVNDVLNNLVSTAEDNSVLLCHLCKLTFNTLHNKHCHFSSRTHTDSLLREMTRVMSLQQKIPPPPARNGGQDGLHSVPHGTECGLGNGGESRGEECGTEYGNGAVRENGTESRQCSQDTTGMGMELDSVECGDEISTADDTTRNDEEGVGGQKVVVVGEDCGMEDGNQTAPEVSDITQLDVPSDNGTAPSDAPVHQTNNDDVRFSQTDEAVPGGSSPGNSPGSIPNPDFLLVEWTRNYAGMLTRLKEHAVAMQPPTPIGTGQTSFLTQFQEQERDLLKHIDSLLSLLHSLR